MGEKDRQPQLTDLARAVSGWLVVGSTPVSVPKTLLWASNSKLDKFPLFHPQSSLGSERVAWKEKELAELTGTARDCSHVPIAERNGRQPPLGTSVRRFYTPQKDQVQFGLTQSPSEPCLSD